MGDAGERSGYEELDNDVTDPTHCRFHRPGATVHQTPRYQGEFHAFTVEDETASDLHLALLRDAIEEGLPPEENAALSLLPAEATTHRAPVGLKAYLTLRPNTNPIPWLGELTTYGSDAVDDRGPFWRAYYSDLRTPNAPTVEIDDVLLASIRAKGGPKGVRRGEQNRHIVDAGDAVRTWCKKHRLFVFRANPPDSTT